MLIQWYPGHMTKARREMETAVKSVDLVIELLDARIPNASRNPDIDRIAANKFRLILLNKSDLASEEATKAWIDYFRNCGIKAVALDSRANKALKTVDQAVTDVCREKLERDRKRGILSRRIKAMVAGIPNVGKSTFINSMAGKAVSKTGNLPGVTRGTQWIRLNRTIDLLDTPGILWPKFDDEKVGECLAFTGAVSSDVVDETVLSARLLEVLSGFSGDPVFLRYGLSLKDAASPEELLTKIAVKKNCMKKLGEPDVTRMGKAILEEFRSGKLGRLTLELPDTSQCRDRD